MAVLTNDNTDTLFQFIHAVIPENIEEKILVKKTVPKSPSLLDIL